MAVFPDLNELTRGKSWVIKRFKGLDPASQSITLWQLIEFRDTLE